MYCSNNNNNINKLRYQQHRLLLRSQAISGVIDFDDRCVALALPTI